MELHKALEKLRIEQEEEVEALRISQMKQVSDLFASSLFTEWLEATAKFKVGDYVCIENEIDEEEQREGTKKQITERYIQLGSRPWQMPLQKYLTDFMANPNTYDAVIRYGLAGQEREEGVQEYELKAVTG